LGGVGGLGGATGLGGAGGRGGGAGGSAGAAGGAAGSGPNVMADCTSNTSMTGPALTATVFCQNLIANCTGLATEYATQTTCEATYTARSATQQSCQSYHLCWGVEGLDGGPGADSPHCMHATGTAPCN